MVDVIIPERLRSGKGVSKARYRLAMAFQQIYGSTQDLRRFYWQGDDRETVGVAGRGSTVEQVNHWSSVGQVHRAVSARRGGRIRPILPSGTNRFGRPSTSRVRRCSHRCCSATPSKIRPRTLCGPVRLDPLRMGRVWLPCCPYRSL